jgi:nucleotide-binding universal stress UspA family protein
MSMEKRWRLLAATDFSEGAKRAVDRAVLLASRPDAELELLHVVSPPPRQALALFARAPDPGEEARAVAAARKKLDDLADAAKKRGGAAATSRVAVGTPYAEISARADALDAELTLVGAHGKHVTQRWFTGATMQKLARAIAGPILIVRREAKRAYRRVLVPVDFSPLSVPALEMAARIAPGAKLYVLHVYEPVLEGKAHYAGVGEETLARHREIVEAAVRGEIDALLARRTPGKARVSPVVKRGYAPGVIKRTAEDLDIELIVMGAQGHSELAGFFLGSVSLHVMLEAETDVLLVRELGRAR